MKFLLSPLFYFKNSCEFLYLILLYSHACFNISMLFSSNIQIKCTILRSSWEKGAGGEGEEEGGPGPSHSEICLILLITL